jgi:hypothetical protein
VGVMFHSKELVVALLTKLFTNEWCSIASRRKMYDEKHLMLTGSLDAGRTLGR